MAQHYIIADVHHGSARVVEHLKKEAKRTGQKLSVSSTGDFYVYAANKSAPKEVKHPWVDAYGKGDKAGMKKYEASWTKQAASQTRQSGTKFQELRPYLEGGKVSAIMGNSDYSVGKMISKNEGQDLSSLLGGEKSAVDQIKKISSRTQDKTAFVYVPHNLGLVSKYQGKKIDYATLKKEVKKQLMQDENFKKAAYELRKPGIKNVAILMHESPKPEKWYKGDKVKSRLPDPLRAYYDSIVEYASKEGGKGKKITVFHGHLHEKRTSYAYKTNTANVPGVKVQHLNIDDIVHYDTASGKYSVKTAPRVSNSNAGRKPSLEKRVAAESAKSSGSSTAYNGKSGSYSGNQGYGGKK